MTSKPETVSQEAWDAAEACFPGNSWNPLTIERIALAIMAAKAEERERFEQERQQMANDWCEFCAMMGVDVDTHEAVALELGRIAKSDGATPKRGEG